MNRIIVPIVALLLCAGPGTVLAADSSCIEKADHEAITYFLVDRSDKLEDSDGFQKTTAALLEMLSPGERVIVGVSTGKGGDTRILMDLVKPKESMWVSRLKIRAQEKHFTTCLEQVTSELLKEEEEYDHSALLETLLFVGKVLSAESSTAKRIVLYSDMMQNSSSLSFYKLKSLTLLSISFLPRATRIRTSHRISLCR